MAENMRRRDLSVIAVLAGFLLLGCIVAEPSHTTTTEPPRATVSTTQSVMPTPFICRAGVVEQSFERGFMFWIGHTTAEKCTDHHAFAKGSGDIWVAFVNGSIPKGKWLIYTDDWDPTNEPESDPSLTPPPGLRQPVRGFGKVWRMRLSEADRQTLGWATGDELPFTSDYWYEGSGFINSQGQFVERPGKHLLKGLAGDLFTFDEVSETVQFTPPG